MCCSSMGTTCRLTLLTTPLICSFPLGPLPHFTRAEPTHIPGCQVATKWRSGEALPTPHPLHSAPPASWPESFCMCAGPRPLLHVQGRAQPPLHPPMHCAQAWDRAAASCPRIPSTPAWVQSYPNLEGPEDRRGGDEEVRDTAQSQLARGQGSCSVVVGPPLERAPVSCTP